MRADLERSPLLLITLALPFGASAAARGTSCGCGWGSSNGGTTSHPAATRGAFRLDLLLRRRQLLVLLLHSASHVVLGIVLGREVGFALGGRSEPTRRKPLVTAHKGQYMGTLNPIHNIRVLGMTNCLTCCGIGGNHFPECEENKRNFERMQAKKKKLHAQTGARARGDGKEDGEWEQVKSTHRGARGRGSAPVAQVAKRSWADVVGA